MHMQGLLHSTAYLKPECFAGMYGGAHSPAKASCHSTDSMHDHGAEPEYETTPSSRHKRRLPSPLHRHAQSMPTIRSLPNLGSDHEAEEVEERLGMSTLSLCLYSILAAFQFHESIS